ncbi:esterase [Mycetocola zhujimingii]|uniref:Esterase n=1 Tax=Mycetocola zhujimingii TaxID=2079792 RepID=A0A2U1TDM3_9MICO|nr:esterase [Mycetocola zhujimingii]
MARADVVSHRGLTSSSQSGFEHVNVSGPHGGIPVRWYQPAASDVFSPVLVWLHGGGFFTGGLEQPESHDVALGLAGRGITVVTVDYRLVPLPVLAQVGALAGRAAVRHPLPSDDVAAVVRWARERAGGPVFLGGASAGACLAATATLRMTDEGSPVLGTVLAYGFFHAALPVPPAELRSRLTGHRRLTHAPFLLDAVNRNYAGSATALSERLAFPGGHDLSGFPPALMIDADRDVMRSSAERFAAELRASGTDVTRRVLPETHHAFLNRPALPEFATAIDLIAGWTARHADEGQGSRREKEEEPG